MLKPMLANKFEEKKAVFPCYVQPKLDGVRCLYNGTEAWTRNLKPHKPHILEMLKKIELPDGITLDGELILPKPYTFQDTISAVKKTGELSPKLEYWVYDCIVEGEPDIGFEDRMDLLWTFDIGECTNLNYVADYDVDTLGELEFYLDKFIEQGYEGLIYRTPEGAYKHGRSGRDLLKLKKFMDQEFQIVDAIEAEGKDQGTPVWVCRISDTDERTFKVRPTGTQEYRRNLWENRVSFFGKMLTVKFQEFTDEGIPRFPVGLTIRDYE